MIYGNCSTSLVNGALDMELVLDLREFSRGKLVDLIWLISISGPPVRIGGDWAATPARCRGARKARPAGGALRWRREVVAR